MIILTRKHTTVPHHPHALDRYASNACMGCGPCRGSSGNEGRGSDFDTYKPDTRPNHSAARDARPPNPLIKDTLGQERGTE